MKRTVKVISGVIGSIAIVLAVVIVFCTMDEDMTNMI